MEDKHLTQVFNKLIRRTYGELKHSFFARSVFGGLDSSTVNAELPARVWQLSSTRCYDMSASADETFGFSAPIHWNIVI